jgi:hypothetical protein
MKHNGRTSRKPTGSTARRTTIIIERPGPGSGDLVRRLDLSALHRLLGSLSGHGPEIVGVEIEIGPDYERDLPRGFDSREVQR